MANLAEPVNTMVCRVIDETLSLSLDQVDEEAMARELDQLELAQSPATVVQLPSSTTVAIGATAVPQQISPIPAAAATVLAPRAVKQEADEVPLPPPPLPRLSPRAGTILASQIPSPPSNAVVQLPGSSLILLLCRG